MKMPDMYMYTYVYIKQWKREGSNMCPQLKSMLYCVHVVTVLIIFKDPVKIIYFKPHHTIYRIVASESNSIIITLTIQP